jgi:hypothetical protein
MPNGLKPESAWEQYLLEFSESPPVENAIKVWGGVNWNIDQVYAYQPVEETTPATTACFYIAVCTQGELVPDRLDRRSPILYFLLDADCKSTTPKENEGWLSLGTAQHNESAPQIHEILPQFPGWFVKSVQAFVPLNTPAIAEYERVLICHCRRDLAFRRSSWQVQPLVPHPYQMPQRPKPGQVIFAVQLDRVENLPIASVLHLLEGLGYQPQLRYRQRERGEKRVELYALIKYEQHDPLFLPITAEMEDHLMLLWGQIVPSDALSLQKGRPRRRFLPSASQR